MNQGYVGQFVTKIIVSFCSLTLRKLFMSVRKGARHIEVLDFSISVGQYVFLNREDLASKPYKCDVNGKLWRQIDLSLGYPNFDSICGMPWAQQPFAEILKIPGRTIGCDIQFTWQILCYNYDLLK